MMGPILASFARVEIERVEEIIEYIGALHRMGKISQDAAVALLKMETDMQLYNSTIGRNINFRFADHSSVWKNPNRLRFFKRLVTRDGSAAVQRIIQEQPIYQNQTHDQLMNFDIHYASFGERLRILEMIRHPVDLIDSWLRRGWGDRFGTDPLALTFCFSYKGQDVPYYALGFEELYLDSTPLGRVIHMIARLWDDSTSAYYSLPPEKQRQVLIISFEDFAQRPHSYLDPLSKFLGDTPTRHTPSALKRQNCPRVYSTETREQKQGLIEGEATVVEQELLYRLIEEYETLADAVAIKDE